MEQLKLELSEYGSNHQDESISVLISAINDIASATEADLESLKSRQWYNRLWNTITFKRKDETILAADVASLAKLNEIVMMALTILANKNVDCHRAIADSLGKIENIEDKLQTVSAALSHVVLEVRNIKYGYRKSCSFNDLKASEASMVRDYFYQYVRQLKNLEPNNESKKLYSHAVGNHIPSVEHGSFDGIDLLEHQTQELLYRIDQSYFYLIAKDFDTSEYFDVFGVSPKVRNQIQTQIAEAITLCGEDYYINNLIQPEPLDYIEDESIIWTPAESIEDVDLDTEISELIIEHMLQISSGEEYSLSYKEVHIKSLINCMGTIRFDHCIVYYNESENADEIKLSEDAEFIATNCVFVCKGYDKNLFISSSSRKNASAVFDGCSFYDCSAFVGNLFALTIDNCLMMNCGINFVSGVNEYVIKNSKIVLEQLADFNLSGAEEWNSAVFNSGSSSDTTTVSDIETTYAHGAYKDGFRFALFHLYEGVIKNCTFINVTNCVEHATTVDQCLFEDCNGCVSLIRNNKYTGSVISTCFSKCKNSVKLYKGNAISLCRFVECEDRMINVGLGEGANISFCEFINCKNEMSLPIVGMAASIHMSGGRNTPCTYIKNCVFDGIIIDRDFLIAARVYENPQKEIAVIQDCDFRNCWTNRESGAIIQTMNSYFPKLSKKPKYVKTVNVINCRGLDRVHVNTTEATKSPTTNTDVSVDGKKVGATILKSLGYITFGALAGVPGVVGGIVIDKVVTEKEKAEEELHQQYLRE